MITYRELEERQAGAPQSILQENDQRTPLNDASFDNNQNQRAHNSSSREILLHLDDAFEVYKELYERLKSSVNNIDRDSFRQIAANIRYYHSILVDGIGRDEAGNAHVGGMHRDQLLDSLRAWDQQVSEFDYLNTCWGMLYTVERKWEHSTPPLFVVLPRPDCWDDSDPITHQFRLYFMCNIWTQVDTLGTAQHIHFSNHPGYDLNRPNEFFQAFGGYVMRVLRMVKHGYCDNSFEVPPLNTCKTLLGFHGGITGDQVSNDAVEPLVDKMIEYLQELAPPKWTTKLGLDRIQSAVIKTHLVVNDGNAEGNLHRYIDHSQSVYWICLEHGLQYFDEWNLQWLESFVRGRGGHVNMQQATLKVDLSSPADADQFRSLLVGSKCTFDVSIKLNWEATRLYVQGLCLDIGKTGTVVLELDGITLDIHAQNHVQCMADLFADDIMGNTNIQCIRLFNYPRRQEQYWYLGQFGLRLKYPSTHAGFNWLSLRNDLVKFEDAVSTAHACDVNTATKELQAALVKHGCSEVNMITIYSGEWDGVFDLDEGAFVEVHSFNMQFPKTAISSRSFRRVTQNLSDVESDEELYHFVQRKIGLKELNISTHGRNVLFQLEPISWLRHNSPCPLRLTLLEHVEHSLGRIVAEVVISMQQKDSCTCCFLKVDAAGYQSPCARGQIQEVPVTFQILQWDCDHIFFPLSDFYACFVDIATQQHPSVLTLFTLDITSLSAIGLSSICNILRRSCLEYLHIKCVPFDSILADSIAQVLGSVQWATIKSLAFTGNRIDDWIRISTVVIAPQLQCLAMQGTGSAPHQLSHNSALFVHRLVYSSPLATLSLQNIDLQGTGDWALIVDAIENSPFGTVSLLDKRFS